MRAERRGRTPTSLRLPTGLLERAEALVEPLSALPAYAAEPLDRSAVLRLAIARGLVLLEREAAQSSADDA